MEEILKDCIEEVRRERTSFQSLSGIHTARRSEDKQLIKKTDPTRLSSYTLTSMKSDNEHFNQDIYRQDEFKNFEKKRILDKFLQNDDIFLSIIKFI